MLVIAALLCGCREEASALPAVSAGEKEQVMAQVQDETGVRVAGSVTLTGTRASQGNAVDCPEIRTDDGQLHPVKGLAADIELGARITVTGHYGISTTCRGEVLIIETLTRH